MEESQDLPDRIVDFEMVKVNRGRQKFCQCYEKRFEVDTQNRVITCRTCGAWIDPFDVIIYLAGHHEEARYQPISKIVDNTLTTSEVETEWGISGQLRNIIKSGKFDAFIQNGLVRKTRSKGNWLIYRDAAIEVLGQPKFPVSDHHSTEKFQP